MDKSGFIAIFFAFVFVSTSCNASLVFHPRKLIAAENNNASATSEVSPIGSPVNESNSTMNTGKSQQDEPKESSMVNQTNSSMPPPIDSKGSSKHDNDTKTDGSLNPVVEKNNSTAEKGNGKSSVPTTDLGNDSCEGSMVSCRDRDMTACVQASKDHGSKDMFLVVKNEGDGILKVNVLQVPDDLTNNLPAFEVAKHKTKRIDISSIYGKSSELIVSSGSAKCVLPLIKSVSVENLVHQLSFYSKQVTPIYAVYASFLVALILGGTWACCSLRKKNQQDGIPYQELEMGLPESSSAVNVNDAEGWDDNWDDDWDEDNSVKSPSGNQVRSVSSDGLVSRSSKKEGWENWED